MCELCEKDIESLVGGDSPFGQVIFIGYDDGPTSGAVKCATSSKAYRFEMLTRDIDGRYDWQAWDHGEEIRIFILAPLPTLVFEQFANALSQEESRRRVAEDEIYFSQVYSILDKADPPELVVATYGISTSILTARQISPGEFDSVHDWFSFLGLTVSKQ